mgnify:FL=1
MIEYLVGTIDFIHPEYIVLDVNGVGYQIFCPNPFAFQQTAGDVKVYTYQYVREDALSLYGFPTREEKALFSKLLSVSGIGPKGGLAILATGEPEQVIAAIEREDERFLTKFPGVGKKTARQMILDLKGTLNGLITTETNGDVNSGLPAKGESDALAEAIEALKALGYADKEIKRIVPLLEGESLSADAYVKKALRLLIEQ